MRKIEIEIFDANVIPTDSEMRQVFVIGGDRDGWEQGRYVHGKWVDFVGNEWANVVLWCELPHPATFIGGEQK